MARLLDSVLGHQETLDRFIRSMESGKLPHTFLFVGPSGVGRKTSALALAQALVCERTKQACGVCSSCLRLEKSITGKTTGTESLLVIEPEKNQIRIEQAHQVLDFLSLRSMQPNRVVIIDGAETLNPQAANSLLKSLEEPPPGTFFFHDRAQCGACSADFAFSSASGGLSAFVGRGHAKKSGCSRVGFACQSGQFRALGAVDGKRRA